jgi:iron complex outermembrane receptor protein
LHPRIGPILALCLLTTAPVLAEDEPASADSRHDVIVVTGTYEPVPLDEADRPVTVLELGEDERLLSDSAVDLLKLAPSIDLRQRAPNNIQGDLSIRGSTFGQTLVLLDGLRVNDAQTGHHSLNLPVAAESIERIEVLRGSGSTLYGSDAVGGVVNFITREPEFSEFRLRGAVGNHGRNQQRGSIALVRGRWAENLTFTRDFSTGFIENRDFRNLALTSRTSLRTALGNTSVLLAHSDRPFGAEQFYGGFNSWERTKVWVGSIRQSLGENTDASFLFRRHTDLFVLYRDQPEVFTNRHASESYQATVRRRNPIGRNAKVHYGLELLHDTIASNNLGYHDRTRGAGYVGADVRALDRFSFTVGGRLEVHGQAETQFSPSAAMGVWLTPALKLRGSISHAFRMPTFTDLYYHDPANMGSPDLEPESAWSYEAGIDWNSGGKLRAELTWFHRRETNGIDYVRSSPDDVWRATNFQSLRFTGVEAGLTTVVSQRHHLDFRYTWLDGAQDRVPGYVSLYVFNYPRHSGVFGWQATLPGDLVARSRLGALKRFGREPYAVWDLYVARVKGRIHPFVQLSNLTAASYQEILGVAMPGREVMVGVEMAVFGPRK